MKCWCTIPTPASIAALGDAEAHRLPVDRDLALVRVVEPVEDVHQRRLAGAVLAEQRVHLALAEVEADVVVGDDAGEALRDVAHLEARFGAHQPSRRDSTVSRGAWRIAPAASTPPTWRMRRAGLAARPSRDPLHPLPCYLTGGLILPAAIAASTELFSLAISASAGAFDADLAVADAAVLDVEDQVVAALELAVLRQLDRPRRRPRRPSSSRS